MLTEDQLEQQCLQWFQDDGWDAVFGPDIRDFHRLLLTGLSVSWCGEFATRTGSLSKLINESGQQSRALAALSDTLLRKILREELSAGAAARQGQASA